MLAPIIKTVTLPTNPDRAFELFTQRMEDWWPLATHSVLSAMGNPSVGVQFEPFEGGRLYETGKDGGTEDWGRVTDWSPGKSVGFLWHPGENPANATQINVTFQVTDTGDTHVTLTHSNWEALGDKAEVEQASYSPGWDQVFHDGFEQFAKRELATA